MLSKKIILFSSSLVLMFIVSYGSYQFGLSQSEKETQVSLKEQAPGKEVSLEDALEQDMRRMEAKINAVNANLSQLVQQSEQLNKDLTALETSDGSTLAQVQAQIDALPRTPEQGAVYLPEESSSARVLAQPKSPSGIPNPVLENYQQETGMNPAEIEALMQRAQ